MNRLITLIGLSVLSCAQPVLANTLILDSQHEPGLVTAGGILDSAFGLHNLQRIDDDFDQYWSAGSGRVTVTAVAKHAAFSQRFGFIDNTENFTALLYVPYMDAQSHRFDLPDSISPLRFGLDPSGSPLFSSAAADNAVCGWNYCSSAFDHMVSWLITGGEFAGDYVIAWEDVRKLGDRDYNDLVIRVSGVAPVPLPAALWLFVTGLAGLVMVTARHHR